MTPPIGGWVGRVERRWRGQPCGGGAGDGVALGVSDERVTTTGTVSGGGHDFLPRRACRRRMTTWLPGEALIELVGRGGLERRIGWRILLNIGRLPPWRAAGGWDWWWCRGHTERGEDGAHGGGVGDEGEDAHRAATGRTHEWEHFIDAGEQQRPGIAGGAAVGRFGGGWVGRWCGRRGRR